MASGIIKERLNKLMEHDDDYWKAFKKMCSAIKENERIQKRLIEKKELQGKNSLQGHTLHTYNKLVETKNEYEDSLQEYIKYFDTPLALHDELGNLKEQGDWKEELTLILDTNLEEINDEERVLQNTHRHLERLMYLEYDMKIAISNVNTYANEEYIYHLSAMNMFTS